MNGAACTVHFIRILVEKDCCRTVHVDGHYGDCAARVNFVTRTGAVSALGYGEHLLGDGRRFEQCPQCETGDEAMEAGGSLRSRTLRPRLDSVALPKSSSSSYVVGMGQFA